MRWAIRSHRISAIRTQQQLTGGGPRSREIAIGVEGLRRELRGSNGASPETLEYIDIRSMGSSTRRDRSLQGVS